MHRKNFSSLQNTNYRGLFIVKEGLLPNKRVDYNCHAYCGEGPLAQLEIGTYWVTNYTYRSQSHRDKMRQTESVNQGLVALVIGAV